MAMKKKTIKAEVRGKDGVVTTTSVEVEFPENDPHLEDPDQGAWRRGFEVVEKAAVSDALTMEECKKLCKSIGLEYLAGYEGRVVQFKFTDGTVDRYGDKIMAKGVDLAQYKKNPQILAFHNSHQFPIGRSLKTWYDKASDSVKGWVLFFDDRVDSTGLAETTYRMVKAGAINTGSIGFIPKKYSRPDEDTRHKLGMGEWGYLFEEIELIEYSIVPIPANPSAMVEPITKGLVTKRAMETIEEKSMFDAAGILELKGAFQEYFGKLSSGEVPTLEQLAREVQSHVPAVEATAELPAVTEPEAPAAETTPAAVEPKSVGKVSVTVNIPLSLEAKQAEALWAHVEKLKAKGYEVTVTVGEAPPAVTNIQATTLEAPDLTKELGALLKKELKSLKRDMPEETRNMLQTCSASLEAALVAVQDLLDADSAESEETGKATPGVGEDGKPKVTEGAPAGAPEVKTGEDLYDPELLDKLDRANRKLNPQGKDE